MTITRSEYLRRIESRMQLRLDFITEQMGIDSVEADMPDREFNELADQVDQYLLSINDR